MNLTPTTKVTTIRSEPDGLRNEPLPLTQLPSAYAKGLESGVFLVTGPTTSPTQINEIYHP